MPFSNRKGQGFENRIAEILADELKVPLRYYWLSQGPGFIANTLGSKLCDVVMGRLKPIVTGAQRELRRASKVVEASDQISPSPGEPQTARAWDVYGQGRQSPVLIYRSAE